MIRQGPSLAFWLVVCAITAFIVVPPGSICWGLPWHQMDLAPPFQRDAGFAFAMSIPPELTSDSERNPSASEVALFEDGIPLGPPHTIHETIRNVGRGAFSHSGAWILFSTSDNSDPNENGRLYSIAYPASIPGIVLVGVYIAAATPMVLVLAYVTRRVRQLLDRIPA